MLTKKIEEQQQRQIMIIKEIEQNKNCNCHTVNNKLSKIVKEDIYHFCCKKCCDCQWEKLLDGDIY